jgi:tetratricopeptide (TPR) repeat protein
MHTANRVIRKSIIVAVSGLFLSTSLYVIGCAGDKGGIQGINGSQASDMNAARSKFESSNDPPLTAETHFAAGQLNETQGNPVSAVQQYEEALKINPNYTQAMFRLGLLYSQLKQYPQALATWKRYTEATNNSAVGYSNLAFCQELSGDLGSAEQSYMMGIERDPKNQACRVNFGLMLARQGRIDEAKAQFASVLSPAEVHYNIASVLQQQQKYDAAKAEYHEAIKADPKFRDAQTRLAELDKN